MRLGTNMDLRTVTAMKNNRAISLNAALDAADSIIERDMSGNNDVVKAMTAWKEYIKALPSAQPDVPDTNVGDMISRQAALNSPVKMVSDGLEWVPVYHLRELPSAQSGWIPVTERLPKADEEDERGFRKAYLVQAGKKIHTARYDGEYWVLWYGWTVIDNVVAWMLLPSPYREGGQDNGTD